MVIYARIEEGLERAFRVKVVQKKGAKKGALEEALEEAIKLWLKQ